LSVGPSSQAGNKKTIEATGTAIVTAIEEDIGTAGIGIGTIAILLLIGGVLTVVAGVISGWSSHSSGLCVLFCTNYPTRTDA
jgi:hypothetical protein